VPPIDDQTDPNLTSFATPRTTTVSRVIDLASDVSDSDLLNTVSPSSLQPYVPKLARIRPAPRLRETDGTVTLFDLSGFTRLTERLQAKGRGGAEEITALINRLFTPIVGTIEAAGGDVLKFAGDAILALFEGDVHATRALETIVRTRSWFDAHATVSTSIGSVRLGMSVAAATGSVAVFELGDETRREIVATGPTVVETAELEERASGGRILLSPGLVARTAAVDVIAIDETCFELHVPAPSGESTGRSRRTETLSVASNPPDDSQAARDWASFLAGPSLVPVLASHEGHVPPEYRQVVVLFDNFCFVRALSIADRFTVMDQFFRAACRIVFRAGGVIDKIDIASHGDKLMAIFGAPFASGEDDERALEAALELRELSRTIDGLEQRFGVNSGLAVAGDLGAPTRRQYTVMGDAVNLAARLMAAAAPGEILVGAATRAHQRERYDWQQPRSLNVKGKAQPVEAVPLVGRAARHTADNSAHFVAILRRHEFDAVRSMMEALLRGDADCVMVTGELGSGTEAVLSEGIRHAQALGARTVELDGTFVHRDDPLFFARELLALLLALAPESSPATIRATLTQRRLPRDLGQAAETLFGLRARRAVQDDVTSAGTELTRTLARLIRALVAAEPAVLVIRHLDRVDTISCDVLTQLLAEPRNSIRLVASMDSNRVPALGVTERRQQLSLSPLSSAQIADGLQSLFDAEPNQALLDLLVDTTHGNLLLVMDVVDELRAAGAMTVIGGALVTTAVSRPLPRSLESSRLARIDRLPGASRDFLLLLAVLGDRSSLRLVEAFVDDAARPLAALTTAGLIRPVGASKIVQFDDSTLCDVAYGVLLEDQRRRLHARVAKHLMSEKVRTRKGVDPVLARHLVAARLPGGGASALAVAHEARDLFAVQEAIAWFERAVEAFDREARKGTGAARAKLRTQACDALIGLATTLRHGGRATEALETLARAMRLTRPTPESRERRIRIHVERGLACQRLGQAKPAVLSFRRALRRAGTRGSTRERALAWRGLGQVAQTLRGDFRAADQAYQHFLRLARASRDAELISMALTACGYLEFVSGKTPIAREHLTEAANASRQRGDLATFARALTARAQLESRVGRPRPARRDLQRAIDAYATLGDRAAIASAQVTLAIIELGEGAFERALTSIAAAREAEAGLRGGVGLLFLDNLQASVLFLAGRFDEALPLARDIQGRAIQLGNLDARLLACCSEGIILTARRDLTAAIAVLSTTEAMAAQTGTDDVRLEALFYRATAHRLSGDSSNAAADAAALRTLAQKSGDAKGKLFSTILTHVERRKTFTPERGAMLDIRQLARSTGLSGELQWIETYLFNAV